jgi:hypothetical protein
VADRVRVLTAAVLIAAGVAACGPSREERMAEYRLTCAADFGFAKGSVGQQQCVMALDQQHRAGIAAMFDQAGRNLQYQTVPQVGPVFVPPPIPIYTPLRRY